MEASTWLTPLRGIAVLATLLVAAPTAATSPAAPAAGGEWNFRVLLDGKEVGWHRYIVRGDGAATEVESRAQFDVRFLPPRASAGAVPASTNSSPVPRPMAESRKWPRWRATTR